MFCKHLRWAKAIEKTTAIVTKYMESVVYNANIRRQSSIAEYECYFVGREIFG